MLILLGSLSSLRSFIARGQPFSRFINQTTGAEGTEGGIFRLRGNSLSTTSTFTERPSVVGKTSGGPPFEPFQPSRGATGRREKGTRFIRSLFSPSIHRRCEYVSLLFPAVWIAPPCTLHVQGGYSEVWVLLSYVLRCCSVVAALDIHPTYTSPPLPIPSYSSSSEAPPLAIHTPPPVPVKYNHLFIYFYSSFKWDRVLYSLVSLYIYTLHTLTYVSYFFFSQSSLVVNLDQDSDSRWPPRSPFPCTLVIYLRSLISRKK